MNEANPKPASRATAEPTSAIVRAENTATPAHCLDCGAPVMGPYCQNCGQRHEPAIQPLRSLLNDAVTDIFTLDNRLYRTLKQLVTHPGFLTNEYVAGRRTRYLPPFRLYLGISVVYFIIFLSTGSTRFFFFWVSGNDPQFAGFVRLLPRLMFGLLPAFAAILALLYRNRRRLYTEHLIFSLHFHAFAFLVLPIVAVLNPYLQRVRETGQADLPAIIIGFVSAATELLVIVYLFISLRRVYGGSRLITLIKTPILFVAYMMVLALVAVLMIPHLRTMVWNLILKG